MKSLSTVQDSVLVERRVAPDGARRERMQFCGVGRGGEHDERSIRLPIESLELDSALSEHALQAD